MNSEELGTPETRVDQNLRAALANVCSRAIAPVVVQSFYLGSVLTILHLELQP